MTKILPNWAADDDLLDIPVCMEGGSFYSSFDSLASWRETFLIMKQSPIKNYLNTKSLNKHRTNPEQTQNKHNKPRTNTEKTQQTMNKHITNTKNPEQTQQTPNKQNKHNKHIKTPNKHITNTTNLEHTHSKPRPHT